MLFNLHTHTCFSDGSSTPEEYVKEAQRQGFHTLGFSDHSPVPFENNFAIREERLSEYVEAVRACSPPAAFPEENRRGDESGRLKILLGLEIDYIPGITRSLSEYREMNCFDYFIGSVHLVRNGNDRALWFIDGPDITIYDEGLKTVFNNDIRKGVTSYFHQVCRMIETEKPDIIGHLDKIRMYNRNRYFREDEAWYQNLVDESLGLIRKHGNIVEVNTRGIYKKRSDALFPGAKILEKIRGLEIPVTLTSDAHRPEELSLYFEEAKGLLREIGFRSHMLLTKRGWVETGLD